MVQYRSVPNKANSSTFRSTASHRLRIPFPAPTNKTKAGRRLACRGEIAPIQGLVTEAPPVPPSVVAPLFLHTLNTRLKALDFKRSQSLISAGVIPYGSACGRQSPSLAPLARSALYGAAGLCGAVSAAAGGGSLATSLGGTKTSPGRTKTLPG